MNDEKNHISNTYVPTFYTYFNREDAPTKIYLRGREG